MGRNILVISPTPTHPQIMGNRARIYSLLTSIESLGHQVYFLHFMKEHGDEEAMRRHWFGRFSSIPYTPVRHRLSRLKRRLLEWLRLDGAYQYSIDEWYDPTIEDVIYDLCENTNIDAVIVEYVFFSRVLECFGQNILKIIDTHDVFTDRYRRYLNKGEQPRWYSTTAKEEAKGLARADAILAIQRNEAEFFSNITDRKVLTVGHIVPLYPLSQDSAVPERILFVGSDNPINVQAAKFFIRDVLPKVICHRPSAELAVAGRVCNALRGVDGFIRVGQVQDLKPAYGSAAVVVNPVLLGTGLKIKTIEALGYGKPVVTTPAGAAGLEEGSGIAFLVAETPAAFADAVVDVLADATKARELSVNASAFASRWNQICLRELGDLLG